MIIQRLFRQMSVTQILSAVSTTCCLLIDSVVICRLLGVESMSAYGLASPLLIVLTALGTMTSVGIQVVCGKAIGAGDREGSDNCYSAAVAMSLGMALCAMAMIFALWRPICSFLGAGEAVPENRIFFLTGDYLKGYILGAPFFFLSQAMTPFLQLGGRRKTLLVSVAAMTAVDIAANLVSVYCFHAGMFGIGLASSLSYLAAFLVGLVFFLQKSCPFRFRRQGVRWQGAVEIVGGGSPVIINQICFTVRVFLLNRLLLAISGTDAVAVFATVSALGNVFFSVGLGTGTVALMLSSVSFGEEDRTSLCELVRVMFRQTLELITATILVAEVLSPWLARLFLGGAPDVLAIAIPALRLYSFSLIPCAIVVTFKNYYQGTNRMALTHLISVLDALVFTTLFPWLLSMPYGLTGVWLGITVGELAVQVVILALAWVRHGGISFSAETLSMLARDFGAKEEDYFDASVTDLNSAVEVSEQIRTFCNNRGMERRTGYFVGLCVEEIAVNTIQHGFTKDNQSHSIDVRLVVKDGNRLIRMRDNCVEFDPTAYMELHSADSPESHIGIRMVMNMVKEANYIHTLGLNNLTLRL